ncbi:MAG: right-handed parallel beta-helix repeat-containing protein [Acidobacteriota bacterium]|nr:right-handed parallel beta-helix repeat-containing protein [Acidobacteriota bacterium]
MTRPAADAQVSLGVNRLLVVSAGGTAVENCQNLRDALAGITGTAMNPYVLRLEPGEYDCETSTVVMKSHVDLEGSGEGVTRVFGNPTVDSLGVIDLADEMEIRFVTVESTGGHTAVSATTGESRITNATLISAGAAVASYGLLAKSSATVRIAGSSIKGATHGVSLQGTSAATIHRSTVEGPASGGIVMEAGTGAVLADSQLINGFAAAAGAALTCLYSYDGNLAELNAACSPPPP